MRFACCWNIHQPGNEQTEEQAHVCTHKTQFTLLSCLHWRVSSGKKNQVRQETLTFNDVLISGYVTLPCDVTPGSVSTDVSSMSLNRTDEDMEVLEAEERHVITPVRTVQGGSVASGFLKGLESEGVPFTVYRQTDAEALASE